MTVVDYDNDTNDYTSLVDPCVGFGYCKDSLHTSLRGFTLNGRRERSILFSENNLYKTLVVSLIYRKTSSVSQKED